MLVPCIWQIYFICVWNNCCGNLCWPSTRKDLSTAIFEQPTSSAKVTKFSDFDWAGKTKEASYPIDLDHLNLDVLKERTSFDKVITVHDDDRVLDAGLKPIRQSLQE